ncbi:MAG: hypothetical protein JWP96_2449 [Polaromonas sp.]|nr:hypothetical protein [Polaromonas sp.]
MKSKLFTALSLASGVFLAIGMLPAMAQDNIFPRFDQPQPQPPQSISTRIQQGVAAGRITPSEAQEFYRRDRELQLRGESQAKSTGIAGFREHQKLRSDMMTLSADIERTMARRNILVPPGNVGGTPDIDDLQLQIHQRIDEGQRLGQLSDREARRLQSRAREIARHETFFKSDGVVTPLERRRLEDELDRLHNEVERTLHTGRRTPG